MDLLAFLVQIKLSLNTNGFREPSFSVIIQTSLYPNIFISHLEQVLFIPVVQFSYIRSTIVPNKQTLDFTADVVVSNSFKINQSECVTSFISPGFPVTTFPILVLGCLNSVLEICSTSTALFLVILTQTTAPVFDPVYGNYPYF